jgi:hypothetical protein
MSIETIIGPVKKAIPDRPLARATTNSLDCARLRNNQIEENIIIKGMIV